MLVRLSSLTIGAVIAAATLLSACGSCGGDPVDDLSCTDGIDSDNDLHGVGCPSGPDCDDSDPTVHEDCCDEPGEDCACDPATDTAVVCFDGPADRANNPPCQRGSRACDAITRRWGTCTGQVLPEEEACDVVDNDCDFAVDEQVLSACGNCVAGCDQVEVGDDPFPLPKQDPTVVVDGVGLDPDGDLVLDQSTIEDHYLWTANDPEGTVSKVDTRTGVEIARYATVTHGVGRVVDHASGRAYGAWNSGAHRPSRTAIDFNGDVWVANRAPTTQPTVTKIRNVTTACVDVNVNGVIDTSHEVNGTPGIQIADPLEFFAEDDECIAFTVAVGAQNDYQARALAIDAGQGGMGGDDPGNVWVGMYTEQAFYQISGTDGSLLQRVPPTGTLSTAVGNVAIQPYGAAIDGQGRLWAIGGCCQSQSLVWIDTASSPSPVTRIATPSPGGAYGIAVDPVGRVWLGSYVGPYVYRYDPVANAWTTVTVPNAPGWRTRGVAIDTIGNVWASLHGGANSRLVRIDADTATWTGTFDVGGNTAVGVAVDFDGDIWGINQSTSNATRLHIDDITGEPGPHPTTGNNVDTFPVGPNPYTYADFTGLALRTVTRPTGDYAVSIQGCQGTALATWTGVEWQATTPPETSVEIYVRAGDDLATLAQAPLLGPWTVSPADLQALPAQVPAARYLLLVIRLISQDPDASPIVHGYRVEWTCPS